MGRQVNFFILDTDTQDFLNYVQSTGDIQLIRGRIQASQHPQVADWQLPLDMSPYGEDLYFFRKPNWHLQVEFIPEQGYWTIDQLESSVVEFEPCKLEGGRLERGRIWAEMRVVINDRYVEKPEEFIRWYNRIERWLKKHLRKLDNGLYISDNAYTWALSGGQLMSGVTPVSLT